MRLPIFLFSIIAWLFIKHFGSYFFGKWFPHYEKYIQRAVNLLLTVGYALWLALFIEELESSITFRAIIVTSFVGALYFFDHQFLSKFTSLNNKKENASVILESNSLAGTDDLEKSNLTFTVQTSALLTGSKVKALLLQQPWVISSQAVRVHINEVEPNHYHVEASVSLLDRSKENHVIHSVKGQLA